MNECEAMMEKLTLLIGNKNYSSWSLRPWLLLHGFGVEFHELQIKLFTQEAKVILDKYSPSAKVPVLIHNNKQIWDSLAIIEYANEHLIKENAWGADPDIARSMVCEMHSGFFDLRNEMPMNIRASQKIKPSQQCLADIARVDTLFSQLRAKYEQQGDYLFGSFSVADAFYAPVVFRLKSYAEQSNIPLSDKSKDYCQTLLAHPSMQTWQDQALKEVDVILQAELEADEVSEEI